MRQLKRKTSLLFMFMFALTISVGLVSVGESIVAAEEKVNINTATKEELKQIVGVGDVISERIIENRPYASLDDLLRVKGIGAVTLDKIKIQGLAVVMQNIALTVNPLLDDQRSLTGNATPHSELRIYINDVLFQSVYANAGGNFSSEIGYVDFGNNIKVVQYVNNVEIDVKAFAVTQSGNVNYNDTQTVLRWDQFHGGSLRENTSAYTGKLGARYIATNAKINIKVTTPFGVAIDTFVSPSPDGAFAQEVPTIMGANAAAGQLPGANLVDAKMVIVPKDSRKIRMHTWSKQPQPVPIGETTVQDIAIQKNSSGAFYFTGKSAPGAYLFITMSSTNVSTWMTARNTVITPISPLFPSMNTFATDPIKSDMFQCARATPANIPARVAASYTFSENHTIYTGLGNFILNKNIDAPPAQIFGLVSEGDDSNRTLRGVTVPNSKVKVRMYNPQTDTEETKVLDVDATGGFSYDDYRHSEFVGGDSIFVTTILNGVEGKENLLQARTIPANPYAIFFVQIN